MGTAVVVGIIAVVVVAAAIAVPIMVRGWIKVARADEALVISGRRQKTETGDSPVTVIVSGRAVVNPFLQRAELISLRSRQVAMTAEAQSEDNVTLQVEAVAIVKVGSSAELVRRAAERFASQDAAIEHFTTEQLEGALRGVVATLPVTGLMRDRKKFSEQIASDVATELAEQGLILDSFQIKGITDQVGYISSLGIPQVEAKRREAEIAQTDVKRAITAREIATAEENLIEQTRLDQNRANAAAEVGKARAEAEQAAALARASAEQSVLVQEAENRQAQLDADVKRVADAERYKRQQAAEAAAFEQAKKAEAAAKVAQAEADAARYSRAQAAEVAAFEEIKRAEALARSATAEAEATRQKAQAEAEAVRLAGQAKADAIEAEAAALARNQEALLARQALDQLPTLMEAFAAGYAKVGSVTVIGSGNDTAPGARMAAEQGVALAGVFESVKATTGLDLGELIAGRATGRAIGEAVSGSGSGSGN